MEIRAHRVSPSGEQALEARTAQSMEPSHKESSSRDVYLPSIGAIAARHNRKVLASLSPAQRSYVQENYGKLLEQGRLLDVSTPGGNGNQPVLTLQRAELAAALASDPALTFSVHTHYHGDIRPENPEFLDKSTIVDAMEREWKTDPGTVFVLPQTTVFGNATGSKPVGAQFGVKAWKKVSDERETTRSALRAAGLDPDRVSRFTVSAHSSGGYPLTRVMAATAKDADHPRIQADNILIIDTVRGDFADGQAPLWWKEHRPGTCTYIDATMHAFTPEQSVAYGWNYFKAADHFEAVQRFFDYRRDPPPAMAGE